MARIAADLSRVGHNELGFTYTIESSSEKTSVAADRRSDDCITEYISQVGSAWAAEQLLSPRPTVPNRD